MPMIQRSLQNETDKQEMLQLARHFPADHLRVNDLPYRLSSWALDDQQNTRLWFGNDHLIGWAVLQTPFWTIDITCQPDLEAQLYPEILAWADERALAALDGPYGRPIWFADVFADQVGRRQYLEAVGFADQANAGEDALSKVFMLRPGELPVKEYKLPVGFCMRPLAGEGEVAAYVNLHQSTFESKNMTVDWRLRTLHHPTYRPDLDLVIAAPDGRLAAFCICWLNPDSSPISGQVEPLGCHRDFRRYALGRVALFEGLRRLQVAGAQEIYVETDSYRNTAMRLYESAGFKVVRDVRVYRKDFKKGRV